MPSLHLSRYAFPFSKDGKHLLYSSKNNSFYGINAELKDLLDNLRHNTIKEETVSEDETLDTLYKGGILVGDYDDDDFLDSLKTNYHIMAYGNERLTLTIAPTIQCNLRCPYCFEESKPKGIMNDATINNLIQFIQSHECAKQYDINWFGGEPLIGLSQIRKILDKLAKLEQPYRVGHSIITNGTLLTDKAIALFMEYPLDSMQITLDGNKESHNKKRFTLTGKGTFDLIHDNAIKFKKSSPHTKLTFRINIDNTNSDEYVEVYRYITELFGQNTVSTYPGILRANKGCESDVFFSTTDHMAFNRRLREQGLHITNYPELCSKGCAATHVSSYVVGPQGELYLCWEHVGIPSMEIGNIRDTAMTNEQIFNRFMNHGHCFDDPECRSCGILPICSGGCPDKRIKNKFHKHQHQLCALYKEQNQDMLYNILYEYYLQSQERNV